MKGNQAAMIIGYWSVDVLYAPGAQEDETIAFYPDGTGWASFERHILCTLEKFIWAIFAEDTLQITFQTHAQINTDYSHTEQLHATQEPFLMPFSVRTQIAPNGNQMEVLTFHKQWQCETTYGLITRNMTDVTIPLFPNQE